MYFSIDSYEKLKRLMQAKLDQHNEVTARMDLVLFEQESSLLLTSYLSFLLHSPFTTPPFSLLPAPSPIPHPLFPMPPPASRLIPSPPASSNLHSFYPSSNLRSLSYPPLCPNPSPVCPALPLLHSVLLTFLSLPLPPLIPFPHLVHMPSLRSTHLPSPHFSQAMEHVVRIARIIDQPRGNGLLVGVGGSGKQSLARLAAFIGGHSIFQIRISASYGMSEFRGDMISLYLRSGLRGESIVFLFTDQQLVEERSKSS